MSLKCINVMTDYGAKGDGTTDDTAAIQAAINGTPLGGDLWFPHPANYYLITATLNVPKSICIKGDESQVKQTVSGQGCFAVTASGVSIRGMVLTGPQHSAQVATERGIYCFGASGQQPLVCIDLCDNVIENWGMYGIYLQYVNMFTIDDNIIDSINYAGIMCGSASSGCICDNSISNIIATPNAYGISITRIERAVNELVSDPLSKNVVVARNRVCNVLHWEALSTHAGQYIRFIDNEVYNCNRGIAIIPCNNAQGVSTYAPVGCIAQKNDLDSGVTDGSAVYGITVSGASTALGSQANLATDCKVFENSITGYGNQASNLGMAMYLVATKNLKVYKNRLILPSPVGIGLYHDNYGFEVSMNEVIDPWSTLQGGACGVKVMSNYNVGKVDMNRYLRGLKVATYVLAFGLYIQDQPNNKIYLGKDYSEATTAVYDPGHHEV